MTTLWVQVAFALLIAASSFTGGWQVRGWKASHDDAGRIAQEAHDAKRRAEQSMGAAAGYEAAKAALRPRTIVVTREVEHAVQADPDCSSKPLPDSLRDALTRAGLDPDRAVADSPMPAASATRVEDVGRSGTGLRGHLD